MLAPARLAYRDKRNVDQLSLQLQFILDLWEKKVVSRKGCQSYETGYIEQLCHKYFCLAKFIALNGSWTNVGV